MRRRRSILLVVAATAGCGATGREWVHASDPVQVTSARSDPAGLNLERRTYPGAALEIPDIDRPPPRPRLSRTITLGETDTPSPARTDAAVERSHSPTVVIVNNYDSHPRTIGYGGFWAAPPALGSFGFPRSSPSGIQPRGIQPGQDWPRPPSYGPAFPFRQAPASAWERPR